MTTLAVFWLPILLAAVFVFLASSLLHMVLPIHKGDYRKLPDEAPTLAALRSCRVPPGQYMFPCPGSMQEMSAPEMLAKYGEGPVGTMVVRPNGPPRIGAALVCWFLFCLVVGAVVANVAGVALLPGTDGLRVFRVTGTVALLAYGLSNVSDSIWKGVRWSTTLKFLFDGAIYAAVTGATFAWLWPAAL